MNIYSQFHAFIVFKKRRKTCNNRCKKNWERIESPSNNIMKNKLMEEFEKIVDNFFLPFFIQQHAKFSKQSRHVVISYVFTQV
jgi:hypothetical protein